MAKYIGIGAAFMVVGLAALWCARCHYWPSIFVGQDESVGLFAVEPRVQWGTVYPGRIRKSLIVHNLSSRRITPRIRSSCGCVRAVSSPHPIPSHSQGVIELELDTRRITGKCENHLLVYVDGMAGGGSGRVILTGTVITDGLLQCDTDTVDFGHVRYGMTGAAEVAVQRRKAGSLDGCRAHTTDPRVSADLRVDETQPSRGIVMLEYRPDGYPEVVQAELVIADPRNPAASTAVMIVGMCDGEVRFQPSAVLLGRVPPGAEINSAITVTPPSRAELSIAIASSTLPPGLRASLTEKDDHLILAVVGRCDMPAGAAIKGSIQLAVTSTRHDSVRIPVVGVMGGD